MIFESLLNGTEPPKCSITFKLLITPTCIGLSKSASLSKGSSLTKSWLFIGISLAKKWRSRRCWGSKSWSSKSGCRLLGWNTSIIVFIGKRCWTVWILPAGCPKAVFWPKAEFCPNAILLASVCPNNEGWAVVAVPKALAPNPVDPCWGPTNKHRGTNSSIPPNRSNQPFLLAW